MRGSCLSVSECRVGPAVQDTGPAVPGHRSCGQTRPTPPTPPTRSTLRHSTLRHAQTRPTRLICPTTLRHRSDTGQTPPTPSTPVSIDTAPTLLRHAPTLLLHLRHLRHSDTSGLKFGEGIWQPLGMRTGSCARSNARSSSLLRPKRRRPFSWYSCCHFGSTHSKLPSFGRRPSPGHSTLRGSCAEANRGLFLRATILQNVALKLA